MTKYFVSQNEPIWVKCFYEVEAASIEEAEELFYEGQYDYVGHELCDRLESHDDEDFRVGVCEPLIAHACK